MHECGGPYVCHTNIQCLPLTTSNTNAQETNTHIYKHMYIYAFVNLVLVPFLSVCLSVQNELTEVLSQVAKNPPKRHHRLGISAEPSAMQTPELARLPRFEKDLV